MNPSRADGWITYLEGSEWAREAADHGLLETWDPYNVGKGIQSDATPPAASIRWIRVLHLSELEQLEVQKAVVAIRALETVDVERHVAKEVERRLKARIGKSPSKDPIAEVKKAVDDVLKEIDPFKKLFNFSAVSSQGDTAIVEFRVPTMEYVQLNVRLPDDNAAPVTKEPKDE